MGLLTKSTNQEINGISTDVILSVFADRLFIAVTQIGTLGTIVEAQQQLAFSGKSQASIAIRLGKRDDPLLLIYARQFLEHFGSPMGLPIIAAIGLKDRSSDTFEKIMNCIRSLYVSLQSDQS